MNGDRCQSGARQAASAVLIVLAAFLGVFGLLCWSLSSVVWLPDLLSPGAEHVIARCVNTRGESIELTQRWAGDGYLTGVRHKLADGTSLFAIGDGDAFRA